MKKQALLCAALLLGGFSANLGAQETEPITLEIIGRVEVEPQLGLTYRGQLNAKAHNAFDGEGGLYSNTSLYTHFEGDIVKGLHFNLVNHWLAGSKSGICSLYDNTWTSQNNWCDFATLSYQISGFKITVGKECLVNGTFEYDPYDYDCHYLLSSSMWNNFNSYQLGAKASWVFSPQSEIGFQFSSSPFNTRPFAESPTDKFFNKGLMSYSLYGFFDKPEEDLWGASVRVACNMMQFERNSEIPQSRNAFVIQPTFGFRYDYMNFYAGFDAAVRFATPSSYFNPEKDQALTEGNININFGYTAGDYFEIFAKAGMDFTTGEYSWLNYRDIYVDADGYEYAVAYYDGKAFFGGVGAYWYPLGENRDLRIHLVAGGHSVSKTASLLFGLTFNFQPLLLGK